MSSFFLRSGLVGLAAIGLFACRIPPPTRTSNSGNLSEKKELESSDPLTRLEQQVAEMKADRESSDESLNEKIRELKDKIDVIEHQFENETKNTEKVLKDFDLRLVEIEKKQAAVASAVQNPPNATTPSVPPGPGAQASVPPSSAEQEYQTILNSYLEEKNNDKAIKDFKKFKEKYPGDPLESNAQYWIAEAYYSKADFPKSITEFQKVLDQYPRSSKRCDALLKQGMAFSNMKDSANAKLFLMEARDQCAGTPVPPKAEKLLRTLK